MTGRERWSTENCARNWNLTILPNGTCTNQNLSWRMRHIKFFWDLEIQTDHLIPTRRPDWVIINKKKKRHAIPFWLQSKNQRKQKERRVLEPCQRTKKAVEHHEGDGDTSCNWCAWNGPQMLRVGGLEIEGQIETIQTTALLRSARILRRVLEIWGDLLSLRLSWETIS